MTNPNIRKIVKPEPGSIIRVAVVENGKAVRVIAKSVTDPLGPNEVVSDTASPGDDYDGSVFTRGAIPVPEVVEKLQLWRALRSSGKLGALTAALNTAPQTTKEDWEVAAFLRREDAILEHFISTGVFTAGEADELFRAAAAK